MDVYRLSETGIECHTVADLPALLCRDDGFLWVDIASCDGEAQRVLSEVFRFHPIAVQDCCERNPVPKLHAYGDHFFVVLLSPEVGADGELRMTEFDQFVSARYLVTVHGPAGSAVSSTSALQEAHAIRERIESGRAHPPSPGDLGHALVSARVRRMEACVVGLAREIAVLERQVVAGDAKNPERTVEALFRVRHALLTVRTVAAQNREVYARMAALGRHLSAHDTGLIEDLLDQFERLQSMADAEKEFLQGVVDLYQTRTATKMNVAMERLALITTLVLPITALASIYGMNVIVSNRTEYVQLGFALLVMVGVSLSLLVWSRRQGWW